MEQKSTWTVTYNYGEYAQGAFGTEREAGFFAAKVLIQKYEDYDSSQDQEIRENWEEIISDFGGEINILEIKGGE